MSRILNKSQAEAVAQAMSQMNNLGGMYRFAVDFGTFRVKFLTGVGVTVSGGEDEEYAPETYANQTEFFEAYGLS
jgi:hypothetical protein